jgi:hypothetical protein
MGGVCSAGITGDRSPVELSFRAFSGFVVDQEFKAFSVPAGKAHGKNKTTPIEEADGLSFSEKGSPPSTSGQARRSVSSESHLTRAPSEKHKAAKPRLSTSGKASLTLTLPCPCIASIIHLYTALAMSPDGVPHCALYTAA